MKKEILKQFKANIPTQNQVDLLAQFLVENFNKEIGKGDSPNGEGAIEMAVRLLLQFKECPRCGKSWLIHDCPTKKGVKVFCKKHLDAQK